MTVIYLIYTNEMLEIDSKQRIKDLEQEVSDLKALVAVLLEEISSLKDKLSLTSKNSSKPPSSDVFKKIPKSQSNNKSGGQLGHEGNTLNMVEKPNFIETHKIVICDYCQTDLSTTDVLGID
ncbi:MAG: bZIP transcription factor, partial [Candidatus Sericytochromatia bacterium]|nr:bZIP transcription factor [Candidatus Sericytochromatia bacterium]